MIQVRHKKRMGTGTEDLSFYHSSLLCCLDQMLAVTELSQHLVFRQEKLSDPLFLEVPGIWDMSK